MGARARGGGAAPRTHQHFGVVGPRRRAVHPRMVGSSLGRRVHRLRYIFLYNYLVILLPLVGVGADDEAEQEQRSNSAPHP
jgi:hypothetical protein